MNAPVSRREVGRKLTISTITGGAAKFFPKLLAASFQKKIVNGAEVLDAQGNAEIELKDPAPTLPLCRIMGYATIGKPGTSEYGEFIKFSGQFRGVNLADGVISEAPQCILNTFLAEGLYGALQTPGRQGPVQFAFEISAKYDESAIAKYVFVVHDLMPRSVHDPLAALEAAVMGTPPPALPPAAAPVETPAPTTAPAPAPTQAPAPQRRK